MAGSSRMRNSKFEMLRIIAMFFIVSSHYSLFTKWGYVKGINSFQTLFFQPLGQIGVDLFVMISGYFLSARIESMGKMLIKDIRLWIKVLFYSWLMLIIVYFIDHSMINIKRLARGLFPVTLNEYWFITSFLILMLLVPMLNGFIKRSKESTIFLLFLVFLFTSGCQSLLPIQFYPFGNYLNLGIMIAAYLFAAILGKYQLRINSIIVISFFIFGLSIEYVGMLYLHKMILTAGIAPFMVAMAIFYLVVQCPDFYNSKINWIAASMFACYLVLCNYLLNTLLWNVVLHINKFKYHPIIPGVFITLGLMFIVVLFDKIYILFERRFLLKQLKKLNNFLSNKF